MKYHDMQEGRGNDSVDRLGDKASLLVAITIAREVVAAGDAILRHAARLLTLARGDTVILTENNSNDSKITVQIPKEWQPMIGNDSVE